MNKHMTIEEFDKIYNAGASIAAIQKYFLSYENAIVNSNASARDLRPLKVLCAVSDVLNDVVISYIDEPIYSNKAKKKYVRIAPEELRELANSLLAIAEANEKLCKHLDIKNN